MQQLERMLTLFRVLLSLALFVVWLAVIAGTLALCSARKTRGYEPLNRRANVRVVRDEDAAA